MTVWSGVEIEILSATAGTDLWDVFDGNNFLLFPLDKDLRANNTPAFELAGGRGYIIVKIKVPPLKV